MRSIASKIKIARLLAFAGQHGQQAQNSWTYYTEFLASVLEVLLPWSSFVD